MNALQISGEYGIVQQARPDSDLGPQEKALLTSKVVPSSLGSGQKHCSVGVAGRSGLGPAPGRARVAGGRVCGGGRQTQIFE